MSAEKIKEGICKECKGKRTIMVKGKKKKCPACKGFGFRVDEIF